MKYDLIIIGGGPAGLAAATAASDAENILIIERDYEPGGILNQCIHNGFGLHYFKEELTGPEYAQRFIDDVKQKNIDIKLDTMVLSLTHQKEVHTLNSKDGYVVYEANAIVLAMGCRERTRGAIGIPGDRPAGILTAGAAQRYVNIEGYMVGKRVVILGSGDIGLIMARRMTLEGALVLACVEVMPYSGGLNRNIVQCLEDYDIPLFLSHTITEIKGQGRVERVCVAKVDENRKPIEGTEMTFDCDTVLLSVGLIPENELSREAGIEIDPRTGGPIVFENMETSIPGIFACGNVVHVHDLVDYVTNESMKAGRCAVGCNNNYDDKVISIETKPGITYTVPQKIRSKSEDIEMFFRVNNVYENKTVCVSDKEKVIARFKRKHLAPGEMEKVVLSKKLLEDVVSDRLIISIEEQTK